MSAYRCIADKACRNPDKDRRGAATEHANTLCQACRIHIEFAIRQLPNDWQDLRNALGEHTTNTGQRVHSTPSPAIPISTRKEAIMAAIVETADRAAAVISQTLHTNQPDARRTTAPPVIINGASTTPLPGSCADTSEQAVHAPPHQLLAAAIAITEPNIPLLATAAAEPALIWKHPSRCATHENLIDAAEATFTTATKPRDIAAARERLNEAYHSAGICEDCGGWGKNGQARELTELSGIQIALQLVELHNHARAELGLTRLRHCYRYPCPDCGGHIYRNDGESIVYCENDPKHTRTEREYQFVAGQLMTERAYMEIREYYLAEGYWRLDRIQQLVDTIADDPRINIAGAGTIILEQLVAILTEGAPDKDGNPIPHQTPQQRATGTDRKSAIERQVDEDNWTWKNEKPYQRPPARRRRKATKPAGPSIHPASLTTLIDIQETHHHTSPKCPHCNLIHAGECA